MSHPNLNPVLHPLCVDVIEALHICHRANPFAKFVGVCNQVKLDMDACLTEEYIQVRKKNFDEAKERENRFKEAKERRKEAS